MRGRYRSFISKAIVVAVCLSGVPRLGKADPSQPQPTSSQHVETSRKTNHGLDVDGAQPINILPDDTKDQDLTDLTGLTPGDLARYKRNNLVGKYLQMSDKLCSAYLQDLTRTQRTYSLIFGSLSTIFGSAGAAFTHASVVRPLSALASISSGERAEIDADTFVKQTSQVIIAGIKNSRARTYNTIIQVNFLKSVTDWPINVALADVQDYHSRCSLNEGITEAAASISVAAPQSTPLPANAGSGVAGRAESPPPSLPPTVAGSAAAGAADAVAKAGGTPALVAKAAAGAATGVATAAAGNPSAAGAGNAGGSLGAPPAPDGPPSGALSTAADVARVQLALVQKARASIVVDGSLGAGTIAALKAFQAAQKPAIPASGVIDAATRAALGVSAPANMEPSAVTPAQIKQSQQLILKQTLSVPVSASIKANGILDAQTIAAIVVYQNAQNLPETGLLDETTLNHLGVK